MKEIIKKMLPYPILKYRREKKWKKENIIQNGVIPHLGILLTTGCNLNCRHCADLIPYRKVYIYKKEDVIRDLQKVLLSVKKVKELLLIGGEVMLYKDLTDIVEFCISEVRIMKIVITTNGTLLPEKKAWGGVLQNPKVTLRVSGYNSKTVPNRERLMHEIHKRGVQCDNLEGMVWKAVGENYKRSYSKERLEKVFHDCVMRYCVTMTHDGKVFFCSRQTAAFYTSDYPAPESKEYLDVRNEPLNDLRKKWNEFYSLKYISTCDYCEGIHEKSENVGTALQIVQKSDFLVLLRMVLLGPKNILVNIETLKEILFKIQYHISDFQDLTVLVHLVSQKAVLNENDCLRIYSLLYDLLKQMEQDYRLELFHSDGSRMTPEVKYGEKNRIRMIVSDYQDRSEDYDMAVSEKDIDLLHDIFKWKIYRTSD